MGKNQVGACAVCGVVQVVFWIDRVAWEEASSGSRGQWLCEHCAPKVRSLSPMQLEAVLHRRDLPSGVDLRSSGTIRVADGATHSVLVVEDDPELRRSLKSVFEDDGLEALVAHNGKAAIELLRSGAHPRPCVILLDLMMPVMNGWNFLDCLRRDASLVDIPVIVMTAFHSLSKHERVTQALRKPVGLESLLRAVRKAC